MSIKNLGNVYWLCIKIDEEMINLLYFVIVLKYLKKFLNWL